MPGNVSMVFEREAEERRAREEHSRSDLDDACDKLENLKNIMIDVGSSAVAPHGMGRVLAEVVHTLEDVATLGYGRRRSGDDD